MHALTRRGEGLSLGNTRNHSRVRGAGFSMLLVLESWNQLGKSSHAAGQEAAQPWGRAGARRVDQGTSSHLGVLSGTAGGRVWWLVALLSRRTLSSQPWPGFGQPLGKGRRASCRHKPFPGSPLHPCPSGCIPRAGCNPGNSSDTFSKGKAQGSKGSSKHGGLGTKK